MAGAAYVAATGFVGYAPQKGLDNSPDSVSVEANTASSPGSEPKTPKKISDQPSDFSNTDTPINLHFFSDDEEKRTYFSFGTEDSPAIGSIESRTHNLLRTLQMQGPILMEDDLNLSTGPSLQRNAGGGNYSAQQGK